jgi:hypothetical protein
MERFALVIFLTLLLPFSTVAAAPPVPLVHHDLTVRLHPADSRLEVTDTVTLPADYPYETSFTLHAGLDPRAETPGVTLQEAGAVHGPVPEEAYTLDLPEGVRTVTLSYGGVISHAIEQVGAEYARGFKATPGIISPEGTVLSGSSAWHPRFPGPVTTFTLTVDLPPGWEAVSQGARTLHEPSEEGVRVRWESPEPQDEIYLVAGPWTEYDESFGPLRAQVFLRAPYESLARKYLDATGRYVRMYQDLIGPYPYPKFALVENFWETGYGMPSFTLLGPRVIRFPFIITSSYPHEILHNWWGNGVYVDYQGGNWSEGLTAYLSDHLFMEQQGKGDEYRLTVLQKYSSYVRDERDFPLSRFTARHSSPSEAVGYGKSLMLFHMLRLELGDEAFTTGLRRFYQEHRFRTAGFDDLRASFEQASGTDLRKFFRQWVEGRGAPLLRLSDVRVESTADRHVLHAVVEQTQAGRAYVVRVPVAVTMEGREESFQTSVLMERKRLELELRLPARPLRLDVDPEFDAFRRLDPAEVPPAISQALGSERMTVILPSAAGPRALSAYRVLADTLAGSGPGHVRTVLDTEITGLPGDGSVAVLGWENALLGKAMDTLSSYDVKYDAGGFSIAGTSTGRAGHSVVLAGRSPKGDEGAVLFVAAPTEAVPGLGRKLPHYHKYSYLVFEGPEPENVLKGRWPVLDSPMTAFLPGEDGTRRGVERGALEERQPLAQLPPEFSSERMMETVRFLASPELEGRGFGSEGLHRAAEYLARKFEEAGLEPAGDDGTYFQSWQATGGEPERTVTLRNVVGVLPGSSPGWNEESVVVGAHYDHLGLGWPDVRAGNRGQVHPGTDDNASGVAVLLELARWTAASLNPGRSVVFAAFAGEEAGSLGSRHYVTAQREYPASRAIGMVNLDTVGRLGKGKLLILGGHTAGEWVHIFRGAGFVTGVECRMVVEPLDASDNVSFEEAGVPAVQLFSGPHVDYHRPGDTPGKIDAEGLVKVASVAKEAVEYLAGREEPLSGGHGGTGARKSSGSRTVSLGTIPDFAHQGPGYRLEGVVPGSAAETAGLKAGDIVVGVGDRDIGGIRDLSDALKEFGPGVRVLIRYMRGSREVSSEVELRER